MPRRPKSWRQNAEWRSEGWGKRRQGISVEWYTVSPGDDEKVAEMDGWWDDCAIIKMYFCNVCFIFLMFTRMPCLLFPFLN